jgi:hypothetical protein
MTHRRRLLVTLLGLGMVVGPGQLYAGQAGSSVPQAGPQSTGPIAARAMAIAAAAPAQAQTRMAPRYKWTAIGLLIGGAGTILSGIFGAEDYCVENDLDDDIDCDAFQVGWISSGVAIAGAGAIVAAIGVNKREPVSPSALIVSRRSVAWRVRF